MTLINCWTGNDPTPRPSEIPQYLALRPPDFTWNAIEPNSTISACIPAVTSRMTQKIGLSKIPLNTLTGETWKEIISDSIVRDSTHVFTSILTFTLKFPAVDFVEQLHPNEGIEDDRVVHGIFIPGGDLVSWFDIKNVGSGEK
jgi:hypothetical protein